MSSFHFRGTIPASKSILNRLLIIRSFDSRFEIDGDSIADDVEKMKGAIEAIRLGLPADCGAAGTTLRFLALRASRLKGTHRLVGSERLFERPQQEIAKLLEQLGCEVRFEPGALVIEGEGWDIPDTGIVIDRSISSQFASAVVLSAWDLPDPLMLKFEGDAVSQGYLQMTLEIVKRAGMWLGVEENSALLIPAGARVRAQTVQAEMDVSSAFAVAALAAVDGEATLESWPAKSLQPDSVFPDILKAMGVEVRGSKSSITIRKPKSLRGVQWNLKNSPDLFPVLSVLCAVADSPSSLTGAPHLVHKESARITKSAELLRLMGAEVEILSDGMKIKPAAAPQGKPVSFDPEHDHRMAMAAAVARRAGHRIEILHKDVVAKSFPEFWTIAGES